MRTKFIRFVDDWEYVNSNKCHIGAHTRLNVWLKENLNVKVVNWHACSTGKDNLICIIVEYYEDDNI